MKAGPFIRAEIENNLAAAREWRAKGNFTVALKYERDAIRWADGTDYRLPTGVGDDPNIAVPSDVLRRAYEALEAVDDRFDVGSDTYIVAEQIDVLLHPEKAGLRA